MTYRWCDRHLKHMPSDFTMEKVFAFYRWFLRRSRYKKSSSHVIVDNNVANKCNNRITGSSDQVQYALLDPLSDWLKLVM